MRLLIATAAHEQLDVVTVDSKFKLYPLFIKVIW